MDSVRSVVTALVVVVVGYYVVTRLVGPGNHAATGTGEHYVSARGVIDAANRITKEAASAAGSEG